MKNDFDILVLGLGATGSAALYHLSRFGIKAGGIDRYRPPHQFGSSHGESRIIRQAYFETPLYVPLVQQAYRMWKDLEQRSRQKLLLENGSLMIGEQGSTIIEGAIKSAHIHHLPFELVQYPELKKKFPALRAHTNTVAVLEKAAGLLYPERCIETLLDLATINGASTLYNEMVTGISVKQKQITVTTDKGRYTSGKLVLCTGPWLHKLLPELALPLKVERRVVHWFKNQDTRNNQYFKPAQLPVYIWEFEKDKMFYGFPDLGNGIKIANTQKGIYADPDTLNRDVSRMEIEEMEEITKRHFNINPRHVKSSVCMYTMTPDENFILDKHPLHNNIIIASPCSGHGFKFASATGKILADLVLEIPPDFDIEMFSIKRFGNNLQ